MALADARALMPGLVSRPHDPAADEAFLGRLAAWLERFSPWVAADHSHPPSGGAGGLWLDITGCAHLFGGEPSLLGELAARLAAFGLTARLGLADTPGAAWAAARHLTSPRQPFRILDSGGERRALAPLPPAALRLSLPALELAERFGLQRIEELSALPPAALVRRFGAETARRLAQAFGEAREPLSPRRPLPPFLERQAFGEPIADPEDIRRALDLLMKRLCARLEREGRGARRLAFTLYRVDGGLQRLTLGVSRASRDAGHLVRLFQDRLERVDPGFGIELAALGALRSEPLEAMQSSLAGARAGDDALPALLDRLAAKLGEDRVFRQAPHESHLPEMAVIRAAPLAPPPEPKAWPSGLPPRPLRLFEPPEPIEITALLPDHPPSQFRWRRMLHRVARAEGPERLSPEWWRAEAEPELRDYFQVEDEDGRRYWLFRSGEAWYLHGLFP